MSTSFGPTALATPANAVTVARIMVSPLVFAMIDGRHGSWLAASLWTLLCCTDGIDGFLARRHGTTRSGAFLDPLADKVLVLGALFALVAHHVFFWLPVALIAVRELTISLYRSWAGHRGVTVPARLWAKVKTVCQQFAVFLALLPPAIEHDAWLARTALWVALALTILTGIQYLLQARALASRQVAPLLARR
jgi:CDP-diacylglycerol---glycerol-3-phosphate 3-phosphatidyltransferase